MRGKFIVLEGIDGSGKSTQSARLAEHLKKQGHQVYSTCEPTNAPIGQMIRDIFKGKINTNHQTIAALFLADRLDHIQNDNDGILKKLDEGFTVICDRYYFSSYAYHGVHMSLDWVIELNKSCADLLRPDLNLFIDVDPKVSMERLNAGRESIELYETLSNLEQVREKYLEAFKLQGDKESICIIDGNNTIEEISNQILGEVEPLLKEESSVKS